jgi:hypothetical protein
MAVAKIGFLSWWPLAVKSLVDNFHDGMRQLGHIEGKTYEVEAHFTDGNRELTQQVAQKLVAELSRSTQFEWTLHEVIEGLPDVDAHLAPSRGSVPSCSRPCKTAPSAALKGGRS